MTTIDPGLIKLGVVGLMFVGRVLIGATKKQNARAKKLRPPQSSTGPAPIAPPTDFKSGTPPMRSQSQPKRAQTQDPGSPWSSTKGPFDS